MTSTDSPQAQTRAPGASLYVLYVAAIAACLLGNLLIRMSQRAGWMPEWAHILLGIVAALPLGVAAVWFWRLLRRELDEMLQRIVLEGMAFALIVYVPLAALYVNLKTAGAWTPRLDPPDILLLPAILVAIGIALAWRRCQ